jgi:hypothetical protein
MHLKVVQAARMSFKPSEFPVVWLGPDDILLWSSTSIPNFFREPLMA